MAERNDFEMHEAKWIENPTDIDNMRFTARNDYAFKKLFGRPENSIILQDFLSAVLELDKDKLEDILIENPAVGNHYQRQKMGILDIKLTLKNGKKISIEMQNIWQDTYQKRTCFYWANRYLESLKHGEDYALLNQCIHISILNETFPLSEEIHSVYRVLNIKNYQPFGDDLEFHFLDLTKLKAEDTTDLEKWLRFIQTDDRKVRERLGRENKIMEYANTIMNQFFSSKEERLKYEEEFRHACDRAWLIAGGEKKGREEGRAEGRHTEKLQTARNMKVNGLSADMIIKCTGLSAEQIAKL